MKRFLRQNADLIVPIALSALFSLLFAAPFIAAVLLAG